MSNHSYLDTMRQKAGEKAVEMKLKLNQINQQDKYRQRFVKYLKNQMMPGVGEFISLMSAA